MNKDAFYDNKAAMSGGAADADADFLETMPAAGERRERVDLRAVWSALYRNRWLIAAVVGVALLLGIAATLLMTPIYRAAASLQIEQQTDRVLGTEEQVTAYTIQDADRFLETQLDIIRSRYLAERVAQELKLFGNSRFLAAMKVDVPDEPAYPLDQRATEREVVLNTLTENLSVSLPRNSRIAQIRFDSPDPVLAARTANAFAANLITANLQRKFDTSGYAREFLAKQLAEAKQRLEESERNMISYARSARLLDTSAGVANEQQASGPRSLTASSLVQLNNSQASMTAQRIQAEQRWRQAS
ncbi:MAG TPA: Wzz/FepE/Etk N-terminal domain-containing protein, partial [Sphingomicrobium sp.]